MGPCQLGVALPTDATMATGQIMAVLAVIQEAGAVAGFAVDTA